MNSKNKKKNIFVVILFWFLALTAVMVVFLVSAWSYQIKSVNDEENAVVQKIKVSQGASVKEVCDVLEDNKLIRSSQVLYLAIRFNLFREPSPFCLKSGVYTVSSSMDLHEIYDLLQSGQQEYVSVIIPEGLTVSKIAAILESNGICEAAAFKNACVSREILEKYGIEAESLEGYLFPDTYYLIPGMDADSVAEEFVSNFFRRIESIDSLKDVGFKKLNDTVILASIVEREYRVASEAPLIASVFTNRINHRIGLYSCATIEYIITELQGKPHPDRITYDDLKIESPYNTYKWAGLPPGPISNPGLVALNAAANPAKTNYYYFVLTDPSNGTHTFSQSFDQHKAAENIASYVSK